MQEETRYENLNIRCRMETKQKFRKQWYIYKARNGDSARQEDFLEYLLSLNERKIVGV